MTKVSLGPAWFLVMGLVLLGGLVAFFGPVKAGGTIMALGPAAACALRAVLPERHVLDLKVRSRPVDIALYLVAALTVVVAFFLVKL